MYRRICRALALCLVCAVLPVGVAYAAMSTLGQFGVNNMGAGTYYIPMQIPPGTSGMAPQLSLNYNSQGGNGLLGMGWSLSGISSISRCPKTMAQDGVRGSVNFDANDRYCLDGQRLIVVGGTYGANGAEYRTEQDRFSRIISYGAAGNGPAWFKVWTKSGQVMEFGNTADSRIEAQGRATARVWALNKLQDTKGNYFTVTYTEDVANGTFYPQRIDYTGNANLGMVPNNSMQFIYEARPDSALMYQAGAMSKNTVRLINVQSYVAASLATDYRLTYLQSRTTGRSQLISVRQCFGVTNCLPATTFGWSEVAPLQNYSTYINSVGIGGSFIPTAPSGSNQDTGMFADINGDGRPDYVVVWNDGGRRAIATYLARQDGTFSNYVSSNLSDGLFIPTALGSNQDTGKFVDVNGDGRADYVVVWNDGGRRAIATYLAREDGTFSNYVSSNLSDGLFIPTASGSNQDVGMFADVNGDGLADYVVVWNSGGRRAIATYLARQDGTFGNYVSSDVTDGLFIPAASSGANQDAGKFIDVNGDGRADYVVVWNDGGRRAIATYLARGDGTFSNYVSSNLSDGLFIPTESGSNQDIGMFADVNGDGIPDYVVIWNNGGARAIATYLARGDGMFNNFVSSNVAGGFFIPTASGSNQDIGMFADVNGDGRSDYVVVWNDGGTRAIAPYLAQGDGTFSNFVSNNVSGSFIPTGSLRSQDAGKFVDVNGDGLPDYMVVWNNGGVRAIATYVYPGPHPDSLTTITTGVDAVTTLSYRPLTDAAVYNKDNGANAASYPVLDLQLPLQVMSSVSSSNGIGGTLTTNYTYGGLKVDVNRGSLGFRWTQLTQVESNVSMRTEFRQDWPFAGMPSIVKKTLPGGGSSGVLSQVVNQYGCNSFGGTSGCTVTPGRIYFPYLSESTASSWDLNGVAMPGIVTRISDYDQWGNPKHIVVTNSDGFSTTTDNIYTNDEANWFLGRLTRTVVTSTAAQP